MTGEDPIQLIARRLIWWQPPEISLKNPNRFLAQVMTLGTWDEIQVVKGKFGKGAFKDVLLNAPPGVFDSRSWSYWHVVFGLPEAEMPHRNFLTGEEAAQLQAWP